MISGDSMIEFKDFYDVLKENLKSFDGDYDRFVDNSPDLFLFLTDLLNISKIQSNDRLKIGAAISYFVIPRDVIPEQIYGPYGYVDDIFLCTFVIKELGKKYGYDSFNEVWKGNGKLEDIVNLCYNKSAQILEKDEIDEILKYSGFRD